MLNRLILKLKSQIWFIPVLYTLISLFISFSVIFIDILLSQGNIYIPRFLLTGLNLSQIILSALATVSVTMMTISFSTIMVVLSTYSSQYSPRTLRDFLNKETTLRTVGIFLGTFIYLIITLLFLKENAINLSFSAFVGVMISIFSIIAFILFIHHVATYMQINKLIGSISE